MFRNSRISFALLTPRAAVHEDWAAREAAATVGAYAGAAAATAELQAEIDADARKRRAGADNWIDAQDVEPTIKIR